VGFEHSCGGERDTAAGELAFEPRLGRERGAYPQESWQIDDFSAEPATAVGAQSRLQRALGLESRGAGTLPAVSQGRTRTDLGRQGMS
jgi:hypothetical protein